MVIINSIMFEEIAHTFGGMPIMVANIEYSAILNGHKLRGNYEMSAIQVENKSIAGIRDEIERAITAA